MSSDAESQDSGSGTLSGLPTTSAGAGAGTGAGTERGTGSEAFLDGEDLRLLLLAARSLASLPRLKDLSASDSIPQFLPQAQWERTLTFQKPMH